jgi:hypothetical protein
VLMSPAQVGSSVSCLEFLDFKACFLLLLWFEVSPNSCLTLDPRVHTLMSDFLMGEERPGLQVVLSPWATPSTMLW